jgi:hypothetical protein
MVMFCLCRLTSGFVIGFKSDRFSAASFQDTNIIRLFEGIPVSSQLQAVSPEAHAQLNQYVQQHGFEALQSFLQKPR